MTDWIHFAWSVAWALALAYGPGFAVLRCGLALTRTASLAAAPAASAGIAGIGAILAAMLTVPWRWWTLLLFAGLITAVLAGAQQLLRRAEASRNTSHNRTRIRRAATVPELPRLLPHRSRSLLVIAAAVAVAVMPILLVMGEPGAFLQRWDALYHLQALQQVRLSGDGSTLHLGSLSWTVDEPRFYPAGYHDIAGIIPLADIPIVLNASAMTLAVVPFVHGSMVLARVLSPRTSWAPVAAGIAAALAPAAPLNEWVHLSPVSNLVAAAMLPGALAVGILLWSLLRARVVPLLSAPVLLGVLAAGLILVGIGITHPNAVIYLLLIGGAGMAADLISRRGPRLRTLEVAAVPVACALPYLFVLSGRAAIDPGSYVGGLVVTPGQAFVEMVFGLLTVWPMALGALLAGLAWLGLARHISRGAWAVPAMLAVTFVLYWDSAIDSTLHLSSVWYRGQDRISMFLTMLMVALLPAGLGALAARGSVRRWALPLVLIASLVLTGLSVPTRVSNARLNFDLSDQSRPRYFDEEELQMLRAAAPELDRSSILLASPFSGGAHLYGIAGQPVYFPVLGMAQRPENRRVIAAAEASSRSIESCQWLRDNHIRYLYIDRRAYNHSEFFNPLRSIEIGPYHRVLAQTPHSALVELTCTP